MQGHISNALHSKDLRKLNKTKISLDLFKSHYDSCAPYSILDNRACGGSCST